MWAVRSAPKQGENPAAQKHGLHGDTQGWAEGAVYIDIQTHAYHIPQKLPKTEEVDGSDPFG